MTANPVEPTLTEALQALFASCMFDLKKGRDPLEVIAKLYVNTATMVDVIIEDDTDDEAEERIETAFDAVSERQTVQ